MRKVVIITDTHFGARDDLSIFMDYFDKFYRNVFFPYLDKHGIKTVLMLGDTFERRKYTNHLTMFKTRQMFFDKLKERGIKVVMITGNHDLFYKNVNMVNSPEILIKDYSNITILNTPQTLDVNGKDICFLPWICDENKDHSFHEIQSSQADLCMGHLEVAGFAMYKGNDGNKGLDRKMFQKYDKVFSGHYHHKSKQDNVYYLGNPYEMTWNDYNDERGFHLFDLDTHELEFIKNPYIMHHMIAYSDDSANTEFDSELLNGCYMKVVINSKYDPIKLNSFMKRLENAGCYDIRIIDNTIMNTISIQDPKSMHENMVAIQNDTVKIISEFIDGIETDHDKNEIKKYMEELYNEAAQLE